MSVDVSPDGAPTRLTRDATDHFEYDPTWSRDGKNIAFVSWDDQELAHVQSVRASGGQSTRVTNQAGHYHSPRAGQYRSQWRKGTYTRDR
ncbi:MAG: PD40 domain-containing protein [Woeseiaceae bacterium]|nr:PD40 domain-containing protein [Woeseiaceae bacterium]